MAFASEEFEMSFTSIGAAASFVEVFIEVHTATAREQLQETMRLLALDPELIY